MKSALKSSLIWLAVVVAMSAFSPAQSQNQSLGDYARSIKKTKPAEATPAKPKVYENDNLPTGGSLSVVGNTSGDDAAAGASKQASPDANANGKSADPSKADSKTGASGDKKPEAQITPGQSAGERKQAIDAWQKKLDGQKDKIALLSRELDVLQREYQLKVSEFYSDTARRAQNPNALLDDDAKYKQQIADKQKSLDDAKTQLTDLQEEARRAGAPNSVTE